MRYWILIVFLALHLVFDTGSSVNIDRHTPAANVAKVEAHALLKGDEVAPRDSNEEALMKKAVVRRKRSPQPRWFDFLRRYYWASRGRYANRAKSIDACNGGSSAMSARPGMSQSVMPQQEVMSQHAATSPQAAMSVQLPMSSQSALAAQSAMSHQPAMSALPAMLSKSAMSHQSAMPAQSAMSALAAIPHQSDSYNGPMMPHQAAAASMTSNIHSNVMAAASSPSAGMGGNHVVYENNPLPYQNYGGSMMHQQAAAGSMASNSNIHRSAMAATPSQYAMIGGNHLAYNRRKRSALYYQIYDNSMMHQQATAATMASNIHSSTMANAFS